MNIKVTLVALVTLTLYSLSGYAWIAGFGKEPLVTEQDFHTEDSVFLAGYGLFGNRPATGIHDEVSARTLYLSDGSKKLLFVSLDAVGFSQAFAEQLRTALTESIDIRKDNILLSATHTHSSIDIQGIWGGTTEQQQEQLIRRVVQSARSALTSQQPVTLKLNQSMKGQGENRRHPSGGIIPQITSIEIETKDQKPVALLFTFGSHPVVLDQDNLLVSSDWVGYARDRLEQELNTKAIFINGVLGDVLPLGDTKKRSFKNAKHYGEEVASQIISSKPEETSWLTGKLSHCTEKLTVEAENVRLVTLTKTLDKGTVLWPTTFSSRVTTRTSVVALGPLVLITVPGEPVTELGRELMKKVKNRPVAVLGLTHDSLGYLIPEPDFGLEGATEEPFSLSRKFAGQVSKSIDRLINQCLTDQHENNKN